MQCTVITEKNRITLQNVVSISFCFCSTAPCFLTLPTSFSTKGRGAAEQWKNMVLQRLLCVRPSLGETSASLDTSSIFTTLTNFSRASLIQGQPGSYGDVQGHLPPLTFLGLRNPVLVERRQKHSATGSENGTTGSCCNTGTCSLCIW